jgi:hypothetical protein
MVRMNKFGSLANLARQTSQSACFYGVFDSLVREILFAVFGFPFLVFFSIPFWIGFSECAEPRFVPFQNIAHYLPFSGKEPSGAT